jgi:molybdopterin molybdotransferase
MNNPRQTAMLTVEQALKQVLDHCHPITGIDHIELSRCLGRTLAADIIATLESPPFNNSAMDGYAIISADIPEQGQRHLTLTQTIAAGDNGTILHSGQAARILTGAPIPPGADCVVIQENCQIKDHQVLINGPVDAGANIRPAGEDIAKGSMVLTRGLRLGPQHIGLAASIGLNRLAVTKPLRVAILTTGDELQTPGQPLKPGQIYNSNQATLTALLQSFHCKIIDYGRLADEPETIEDTLQQAAASADLIISSGGVSVGDRDYLKEAIDKLGQLELWRIAIKPGKPMAFGHIGSTPFFGLPGNPVSLMITFALFTRPYLLKQQGCTDFSITPIRATARFEHDGTKQRQEYLRARLQRDDNGDNSVIIFPNQGSAVLTSTCWADCLAIIPPGTRIQNGTPIDVIRLSDLLA